MIICHSQNDNSVDSVQNKWLRIVRTHLKTVPVLIVECSTDYDAFHGPEVWDEEVVRKECNEEMGSPEINTDKTTGDEKDDRTTTSRSQLSMDMGQHFMTQCSHDVQQTHQAQIQNLNSIPNHHNQHQHNNSFNNNLPSPSNNTSTPFFTPALSQASFGLYEREKKETINITNEQTETAFQYYHDHGNPVPMNTLPIHQDAGLQMNFSTSKQNSNGSHSISQTTNSHLHPGDYRQHSYGTQDSTTTPDYWRSGGYLGTPYVQTDTSASAQVSSVSKSSQGFRSPSDVTSNTNTQALTEDLWSIQPSTADKSQSNYSTVSHPLHLNQNTNHIGVPSLPTSRPHSTTPHTAHSQNNSRTQPSMNSIGGPPNTSGSIRRRAMLHDQRRHTRKISLQKSVANTSHVKYVPWYDKSDKTDLSSNPGSSKTGRRGLSIGLQSKSHHHIAGGGFSNNRQRKSTSTTLQNGLSKLTTASKSAGNILSDSHSHHKEERTSTLQRVNTLQKVSQAATFKDVARAVKLQKERENEVKNNPYDAHVEVFMDGSGQNFSKALNYAAEFGMRYKKMNDKAAKRYLSVWKDSIAAKLPGKSGVAM